MTTAHKDHSNGTVTRTKQSHSRKSKTLLDYLEGLEKWGNKIFYKKSPNLPESAINPLIKAWPYLAIVCLAFFGPFYLLTGVFGSFTSLFVLDFTLLLASLSNLLALCLVGLSIPGLFKQLRGAWKLNFYASLLMLFGILNIRETNDLLAFVILYALSWYLLFQLRKFYKK